MNNDNAVAETTGRKVLAFVVSGLLGLLVAGATGLLIDVAMVVLQKEVPTGVRVFVPLVAMLGTLNVASQVVVNGMWKTLAWIVLLVGGLMVLALMAFHEYRTPSNPVYAYHPPATSLTREEWKGKLLEAVVENARATSAILDDADDIDGPMSWKMVEGSREPGTPPHIYTAAWENQYGQRMWRTVDISNPDSPRWVGDGVLLYDVDSLLARNAVDACLGIIAGFGKPASRELEDAIAKTLRNSLQARKTPENEYISLFDMCFDLQWEALTEINATDQFKWKMYDGFLEGLAQSRANIEKIKERYQ